MSASISAINGARTQEHGPQACEFCLSTGYDHGLQNGLFVVRLVRPLDLEGREKILFLRPRLKLCHSIWPKAIIVDVQSLNGGAFAYVIRVFLRRNGSIEVAAFKADTTNRVAQLSLVTDCSDSHWRETGIDVRGK